MRARKKNWAENELASNSLIIENSTENKGKWSSVFGNDNPIHVEIGCGKGNFITESALRNPDLNYIGLEREEMVIISGARRLREINEAGGSAFNVRFICADAVTLHDIFHPGEIQRIYLNFSDPWPRRKKWAKRRLTHRNFIAGYEKLLSGEREIHMKTDNRIMFEFSLNEFAAMGWGLKNISLDLHASAFAEENIVTEYESKFAAMGMPIYRLEAFFPNKPALECFERCRTNG